MENIQPLGSFKVHGGKDNKRAWAKLLNAFLQHKDSCRFIYNKPNEFSPLRVCWPLGRLDTNFILVKKLVQFIIYQNGSVGLLRMPRSSLWSTAVHSCTNISSLACSTLRQYHENVDFSPYCFHAEVSLLSITLQRTFYEAQVTT